MRYRHGGIWDRVRGELHVAVVGIYACRVQGRTEHVPLVRGCAMEVEHEAGHHGYRYTRECQYADDGLAKRRDLLRCKR